MTSTRLPDEGVVIPKEVRNDSVAHLAHVSVTMLKLMDILSDGKSHSAEEMKEILGIHIRSVYHYVNRLKVLGFKVRGAAGVGYIGRAPTKYTIVAMHCITGLPAFIETCNNPIKAIQEARNSAALASLGYYRFWALPIYEDNYAQSNGERHQGLLQVDCKNKGYREGVRSPSEGYKRPFRHEEGIATS